MRRRGASPGRPVRVLESRTVVVGNIEPGGFAGNCWGPSRKLRLSKSGTLPRLTNLEVTMKMVKSLLLGSAAGLVAVAGAQAADLPVKAKPVEYVKVCSLYGAGFFYIPGTDTCIKLGGAVRVQAEFNAGAGGIPVGLGSSTEAPQGQLTRSGTNDVNFRNRIYFSVDARQQTEYGTLRTYFRFGVQQTTPVDQTTSSPGGAPGDMIFWDRAFIQYAGFTVGKTVSFFDGITLSDFAYT